MAARGRGGSRFKGGQARAYRNWEKGLEKTASDRAAGSNPGATNCEIGPNVEDEAGLVVVWPLMEKRGKCRGKISGLEKLDKLVGTILIPIADPPLRPGDQMLQNGAGRESSCVRERGN